jgi:chromatin segregation and condensation protein Rec8/ScpA/Scc1 (kleisin family)
LNNELNAKGYFIYDGNREEVYLSILETGDDVLIAKLEEYLNFKDEIARVAQLNTKFSNVIKDIMAIETKVSIVALADNFIKDHMVLNG